MSWNAREDLCTRRVSTALYRSSLTRDPVHAHSPNSRKTSPNSDSGTRTGELDDLGPSARSPRRRLRDVFLRELVTTESIARLSPRERGPLFKSRPRGVTILQVQLAYGQAQSSYFISRVVFIAAIAQAIEPGASYSKTYLSLSLSLVRRASKWSLCPREASLYAKTRIFSSRGRVVQRATLCAKTRFRSKNLDDRHVSRRWTGVGWATKRCCNSASASGQRIKRRGSRYTLFAILR